MAVSGSAGSEPGLSSPRLFPVPSAWWETPAVTCRVLAAQPESAGTARHFTREVLVSWGVGELADEAETIIGELVVNAVQHGTRPSTSRSWRVGAAQTRGVNGYPRARARAVWGGHRAGASYPEASPEPTYPASAGPDDLSGDLSGDLSEAATPASQRRAPWPGGPAGTAEPAGDRAGQSHRASGDHRPRRSPGGWRARGAPRPAVLRLCLLRRAGEVMLAVIDASDDAPAPRQPDWVKESGRGLQIVHALSSVWGWSPIEGRGKAVWAVLPYELRAPGAAVWTGPLAGARETRWTGPAPGRGLPAGHPCAAASG